MGTKKPFNPDLLIGSEATLLGEVLSITNKEIKAFLKQSETKPKKTDKKLGDILHLEAAVLLISKQKLDAAVKITTDFEKEFSTLKKSGKLQKIYNDEVKYKQLVAKSESSVTTVEHLEQEGLLLLKLGWFSIYNRFPEAQTLRLRNDGSIVDVTPAEGEICLGCGKVHNISMHTSIDELLHHLLKK